MSAKCTARPGELEPRARARRPERTDSKPGRGPRIAAENTGSALPWRRPARAGAGGGERITRSARRSAARPIAALRQPELVFEPLADPGPVAAPPRFLETIAARGRMMLRHGHRVLEWLAPPVPAPSGAAPLAVSAPLAVTVPATHRREREAMSWGLQILSWGGLVALIALAWWS